MAKLKIQQQAGAARPFIVKDGRYRRNFKTLVEAKAYLSEREAIPGLKAYRDKFTREWDRWLESIPCADEYKTDEYRKGMLMRVQRGGNAVSVGSGDVLYGAEPHDQILGDTLANILHWVDSQNVTLKADGQDEIDFDACLDKARRMRDEERDGEL